MNSSAFGKVSFEIEKGERIPIKTVSSSRYSFFKTRLNGMMQFVKMPAEESASDLLVIEALRKEFAIAYPLNHPGIVRYLKFEEDTLYEEYVDGLTLRELLDANDPRLKSPDFTNRLALSLLEALEYIHSEGVTHLDIKPENVMITRIGSRLKIIDFSCARSGALDSTPGYTPEYMAPEQKEGQTGIETDIYLAGVTIREVAEAARQTRRWKKFIRKATSEDPSDRFRSATEAIAALPARRENKNTGKIIAMAAGGGAIFSAAIFLLFFRSITPAADVTKRESNGIERDTIFLSSNMADHTIAEAPEIGNNPQPSRNEAASSLSSDKVEIPSVATEPARGSAIEATLASEIKKYVQQYYKRNVHPACQTPGYTPDGMLNRDREEIIRNAITKGLADCRQYRDRLAAKYPAHADFIIRYADEVINNEQFHLTPILEKSDKVNKPAMQPDSEPQNESGIAI